MLPRFAGGEPGGGQGMGVWLEDGVGRPQAEAGAFAGELRRDERSEDPREDIRADARPGVEHREARLTAILTEPDREEALTGGRGHRFARVLNQVEQDLL